MLTIVVGAGGDPGDFGNGGEKWDGTPPATPSIGGATMVLLALQVLSATSASARRKSAPRPRPTP